MNSILSGTTRSHPGCPFDAVIFGRRLSRAAFVGALETRGVRVSMDGKGRFLDNIFIERLWRSLKYEEVFIKAYGAVTEARGGIGSWLSFYNDERPHQALGYRTPREVFDQASCAYVDNAPVSLRFTSALSTYAQDQQQEASQNIALT